MGACELTDGTYGWPEGMVHYVNNHHVRLPDEIVNHILSQSKFPTAKAAQVPDGIPIDITWWRQQQGWQAESDSFLSGHDQAEKDYLRRLDRNQIFFNDTTDVTAEATTAREKMLHLFRDNFATK